MLSCHTWPQWRGPSVDGVTYLVREVPIGPGEYAFGRTKVFIRSAKTVRTVAPRLCDRFEEVGRAGFRL